MQTDEELMRSYLDGDSEAFRELFQRYAPILLRLMRRGMSRTQDAQDLVQKTFLQLHRARKDFRPDSQLRPWLMTIALNLKREHLRQIKRKTRNDQSARQQAETEERAFYLDDVERSEAKQQVHDAIARLPQAQREVIELHWFEGHSFPEVAEIVGASLSAVKVRAHRGYKRLKEILAPQVSA